MKRRDFLKGIGAVGSGAALAGCSDDERDPQPTPTEQPETAVQYFFEDETGALGHLTENPEQEMENTKTITNTETEQEYKEKQTNDTSYARDAISDNSVPNQDGWDTSLEKIIDTAQKAYQNPENIINEHSKDRESLNEFGINPEEEPEINTFIRSLIHAADQAGVFSSGGKNMIIPNIAETALQQIQPGFTENIQDFKLSTVYSSEPLPANSRNNIDEDSIRETEHEEWAASGFRHPVGLLQYNKNGETHLKYVELTDPFWNASRFYPDSIREPEDSIYRETRDKVNILPEGEPGSYGTMFPQHYVTAADYTKGRKLEKQQAINLGDKNQKGDTRGFGDYMGVMLNELVDDLGRGWSDSQNPDRDFGVDHSYQTLVTDSFGESIENYIVDPDPEKRRKLEETARGLYQIMQEEEWDISMVLAGTVEKPEFYKVGQKTVNQIRESGEWDYSEQNIKPQILE